MMKPITILWFLSVLVLSCRDSAYETKVPTLKITQTEYQAIKNALYKGNEDKVDKISLSNLIFYREFSLGQNLSMIVISRKLSGSLVLFNAGGSKLDMIETSEIMTIQLFDLDNDGVSEIITDDITGSGTGVLEKSYNIYEVSQSKIKKIWSAVSYSGFIPDPYAEKGIMRKQKIAFIRFENLGFSYVLIDEISRTCMEKDYRMENLGLSLFNQSPCLDGRIKGRR